MEKDPIGEALAANDRNSVIEACYQEIKEIASGSIKWSSDRRRWQTTTLANEVVRSLLEGRSFATIAAKGAFLAYATTAARRVLMDAARNRKAAKRGAGMVWTDLDGREMGSGGETEAVRVLALDQALNRLEAEHPRWAKVIELSLIGGFKQVEIAEIMGSNQPQVSQELAMAKMALRRDLGM